MSLNEKLSLRIVKTEEDPERSKDGSASGVCGKCGLTFPERELGRMKGFKGPVCKKCVWADFWQMVMIALGAALVLGVVLFILARR